MERRRIKNWYTAMAVLFAVMAVIVILRDLALFGPDFVAQFFVNQEITNEKVSLVMFSLSGILFAIGLKKSKELYRRG
ncbi:MAG: hypothetical protein ACE5KA_08800 [Nitrososphaerales archaeon]